MAGGRPPPEPALTLWEYFHRTPWWDRRNRLLTPVLVFDQFEELFTLGRNDARAAALLEQLADLAENRIPPVVRARLEQGAALDFDYNQPNYALVISLREDFLPEMDDLRDRLPSLLQNRLRLLPLNGAQALEAVAQPAPELLGPALAEEIVRFVAGVDRGSPTARAGQALTDLTVEPALLALVCQQLNQQRLQQDQATITAALLHGSRDRLLPDFYERCVADVDVGMRQFIEERLLTASGFRRAEAVDDALRWPGVSETALATLIDRRLLRREERFGVPHIELVHDVLTGTVQASRDLRRRREVARRRRRRWLLVGGTVGGIAGLALATALIFANLYWQAETQRLRAEQHRQQAEQLINFMLFDLRDNLEKVGWLDLLEQPAQGALDYFSQLPKTEMTPEALRQREVALNNIGDVFLAKGDLSKALAAYQAGLVIAERLAQQDPADAGWQRDLSVSHEKIGEARQAQGDLAGALAAYQAGQAIAERLAQQDPANAGWQRDLAVSHNKIGEARQAQDDLAGALAAYQAGLAIAERLAQQDPANAGWQRDLSVSHEKIGTVRQAQGDLAGALAAYQAGQAIHQRLAQQDPANAGWQRDLAVSHEKIGTVRQAQGDLAGALAAYQAGQAIHQRLAQQDPANAGWQRDLAVSHNKIGEARQAQDDLAGALAAYQAGQAIHQRLVQQDPTNAGWQRDLAVSHNNIGTVRRAQGDLAGALAAYQADLAIAERLAQQDPANAGWQRDLAVSYERLGELYAQQSDPQARMLFEKELDIATKLFAKTQAAEAPRFLAFVYTRLVKVCVAQGDTQAALAYQRQLVAQRRQLANPSDLANALPTLAHLENKAGHTRTALDVATEAIKLARDLHAQQNSDDSRRLLARVLGNQSFFLLFDRQFKEAVAAAEEALRLDPDRLRIATNQAHGYLLSGQFEKAKAIYRQHPRDKVNDRQTFAEVVLDDFAKLRQRGIVHPDMKKIEKLLRAGERQPP